MHVKQCQFIDIRSVLTFAPKALNWQERMCRDGCGAKKRDHAPMVQPWFSALAKPHDPLTKKHKASHKSEINNFQQTLCEVLSASWLARGQRRKVFLACANGCHGWDIYLPRWSVLLQSNGRNFWLLSISTYDAHSRKLLQKHILSGGKLYLTNS